MSVVAYPFTDLSNPFPPCFFRLGLGLSPWSFLVCFFRLKTFFNVSPVDLSVHVPTIQIVDLLEKKSNTFLKLYSSSKQTNDLKSFIVDGSSSTFVTKSQYCQNFSYSCLTLCFEHVLRPNTFRADDITNTSGTQRTRTIQTYDVFLR